MVIERLSACSSLSALELVSVTSTPSKNDKADGRKDISSTSPDDRVSLKERVCIKESSAYAFLANIGKFL